MIIGYDVNYYNNLIEFQCKFDKIYNEAGGDLASTCAERCDFYSAWYRCCGAEINKCKKRDAYGIKFACFLLGCTKGTQAFS